MSVRISSSEIKRIWVSMYHKCNSNVVYQYHNFASDSPFKIILCNFLHVWSSKLLQDQAD